MIINRCPYCMEDMGDRDICPHCHRDSKSYRNEDGTLPYNTILNGKYLIGSVMGRGGFGITYIGCDLSLNVKVAIKEYFPLNYAYRQGRSKIVSWSDQAVSEGISNNGNSFLQEARKMAKVDELPGMVRVRETFMSNDTAYIVMDYVEGITLKQYLKEKGSLAPALCINLLRPIMNSLSLLHGKGIIHRDISPDNIMIQPDGSARLLDLGASCDTKIQENNGELVFKKSFSPPEQYISGGKIGPWTDVYALCATIYYASTGILVPDSLLRLQKDNLQPIVIKKNRGFAKRLNKILKKGLALKPEDRYQSVDKLLSALNVLVPTKTSFMNTVNDTIVNVSDVPSDPIGGTIGAVLGSLIGVVFIILCYVYLERLYSIIGLVVVLCSLKGYQIMGGSLDKKSRIIVSIVTVIMLFAGIYMSYTISLYNLIKDEYNVTFSNVFYNLLRILKESDLSDEFYSEVAYYIGFAAIGVISNIYTTRRNKKKEALKAGVKPGKKK